MKQKTLREDAHSREEKYVASDRSARECAKRHILFILLKNTLYSENRQIKGDYPYNRVSGI